MNDDIKPGDWINASECWRPVPKKFEPKIDTVISEIAGKKIYAQDPRVLKLIVKWKKGKSSDSDVPDNFLSDPRKVDELRSVLSGSL